MTSMRGLSVWFSGVAFLGLVACGGPVGEGDGVVDDTEIPGVGWEAVFETFSHDVAGRAVIVDEQTIELQDFTYDGGGVNARLFLLPAGGDFTDDFELTDNLVGTEFDNDTLVIDIPEDAPFEDWNLITLWCVPFRVDFGSGVFQPPEE
ncbi:MAG: DM13 domain-containing protein [Myxococcota bacterium]